MINRKKHSDKKPGKQAAEEVIAEPNKIGASTPYDFEAKNLTAYGGLLPVATMLEKLGFPQLVEETLTVKRITRAMPMYQFVLDDDYLRRNKHVPAANGKVDVPVQAGAAEVFPRSRTTAR